MLATPEVSVTIPVAGASGHQPSNLAPESEKDLVSRKQAEIELDTCLPPASICVHGTPPEQLGNVRRAKNTYKTHRQDAKVKINLKKITARSDILVVGSPS